MNYYEASIPAGEEQIATMVPFASTYMRAVTGAIGFLGVMVLQKKLGTLVQAAKDRKGMTAAFWATTTGPFIGVSLSLMAVQYPFPLRSAWYFCILDMPSKHRTSRTCRF